MPADIFKSTTYVLLTDVEDGIAPHPVPVEYSPSMMPTLPGSVYGTGGAM